MSFTFAAHLSARRKGGKSVHNARRFQAIQNSPIHCKSWMQAIAAQRQVLEVPAASRNRIFWIETIVSALKK
jgi:hypothetical protein